MDLIGFNGKIGSGKDTAGDYLVAEYGYTRLSFAAPLKSSAAASLGLPADPLTFEEWKNNPDAKLTLTIDGIVETEITVRQYLQFYGTEGHRGVFGDDFWTRQLLDALPEDGKFVITDARFENECGAVLDAGGDIILIEREAVADTGDTHASEANLPDDLVSTTLYNNGSIEDLYATLDAYMSMRGALVSEGLHGAGGVGIAEVGR